MISLINRLVQYYQKRKAENYALETICGSGSTYGGYRMTFYPHPLVGEMQERGMLLERSRAGGDTIAQRVDGFDSGSGICYFLPAR